MLAANRTVWVGFAIELNEPERQRNRETLLG
jgi:hypothetical protein